MVEKENWRTIRIIRDQDFGLTNGNADSYTLRQAARAVLMDSKKRIGLIRSGKRGCYKLPGGGLEAEESIEKALLREVAEESGWKVKIVQKLGVIREERRNFQQVNLSYGFLCQAVEFVGPNMMDDEIEDGFELIWVSDIKRAIKLVESVADKDLDYAARFFTLRELSFLKEAEKIL